MRTVVLGPRPPELEALIARRRQHGLDQYDEVWEGEYHMAPMAHSSHGRIQARVLILLQPAAAGAGLVMSGPFNLGAAEDFRVPDLGVFRDDPDAVWVADASMVVEIESIDDETWEKLPFYAAHGVEEVLVVSAERRSVHWFVLAEGTYAEVPASRLLGMSAADLRAGIGWADPG